MEIEMIARLYNLRVPTREEFNAAILATCPKDGHAKLKNRLADKHKPTWTEVEVMNTKFMTHKNKNFGKNLAAVMNGDAPVGVDSKQVVKYYGRLPEDGLFMFVEKIAASEEMLAAKVKIYNGVWREATAKEIASFFEEKREPFYL